MLRTFCNGCGKELKWPGEVCVKGERVESGGGVPDGLFHLCRWCAVVAFHAAITRPNRDIASHEQDLAREIQGTLKERKTVVSG